MQKTTTTIELDDLSIDTPYLTIDGNLRITIETETAPPLMSVDLAKNETPANPPEQFPFTAKECVVTHNRVRPAPQLEFILDAYIPHGELVTVVYRAEAPEQGASVRRASGTAVGACLQILTPQPRPVRPDPRIKSEEEIRESRDARKATLEAMLNTSFPILPPQVLKAVLGQILESQKGCLSPFCADCDGNKPFAPLLSTWRTRLLERAAKLKNPEDKAPLLETAKQIDSHLELMGMQYGQAKFRDVLPLNVQQAQLIDRLRAVWLMAPTPVAP